MNSFVNGLLWSLLGLLIMIGVIFIQAKRKAVNTNRLELKKEILRIIAIWSIVMIVIFVMSLNRS